MNFYPKDVFHIDGKVFPSPRFYDKYLERVSPELYKQVKANVCNAPCLQPTIESAIHKYPDDFFYCLLVIVMNIIVVISLLLLMIQITM